MFNLQLPNESETTLLKIQERLTSSIKQKGLSRRQVNIYYEQLGQVEEKLYNLNIMENFDN
jgi:hypothetical protein